MRVVIGGLYPEEEGRIPGGVEAVTSLVAQELASREEVDLHVVTVRRSNKPDEIRRVGNCTVHYLAKANRLPLSLRIASADPKRILAKLREIQPDIVHAHGIDSPAVAAIWGGFPLLLCVHGILFRDVMAEARTPWDLIRFIQMRRLERTCLLRTRYLHLITSYVNQVYGSLIRAEKTWRIENPIEDIFFDIPAVKPTGNILFLGVCRPLKGLHFLVDAFAQVSKTHPEAHLRIGGRFISDKYRAMIEQKITRYGLEDRVHLLGHLSREQVVSELAQSQALCLLSMQEVKPIVIEQAMAAGRPVIASHITGIPEQVGEGKTGYLVGVGDTEGAAQALCRILDDWELTQRMGSAAKQYAKDHYRLRLVGDQTLSAYREILGNEIGSN